MMKGVLLNSSLDDYIINVFVFGVGTLILLYVIVKKLKDKQVNSTVKIPSFDEKLDVGNYTLTFNFEDSAQKQVPLLTKVVLCSLSAIIIAMPFYEFVETLRPGTYVYYWSCLQF